MSFCSADINYLRERSGTSCNHICSQSKQSTYEKVPDMALKSLSEHLNLEDISARSIPT